MIRRNAAAPPGIGDAVVVNTCAVTAEAVRQARQAIRKVAPRAAGGAHRRHRLRGADRAESASPPCPRSIACSATRRSFGAAIWSGLGAMPKDRASATSWRCANLAPQPVDALTGHTRGFVQVQTGCDHRCTFCIIPFGRGNSRSVPVADVVAQVRRLVENGYREVVLTGVDITGYGADLAGAPRLGALVKQVLKEVPELERLRLSSINSVEADADLLDALASEPRLMPHLHLSLQIRRRPDPQADEAAALARRRDRVLRTGAAAAARRGVRRRHHRRLSDRDRGHVRRSLDLVDECGLTHLHVFPFSPRPGTPAARMPQVAGDVRQGTRVAAARQGRGGIAPVISKARSARGAAC